MLALNMTQFYVFHYVSFLLLNTVVIRFILTVDIIIVSFNRKLFLEIISLFKTLFSKLNGPSLMLRFKYI